MSENMSLEMLGHLHQETDPMQIVKTLQDFFHKLYSSRDPAEVLALYSTASMLEAMGLNQKSVNSLKSAIKAHIESRSSEYPATWKGAKVAIQKLASEEIYGR